MYEDEISMITMYSGCLASLDENSVLYLEKVVRAHSQRILHRSDIIRKSISKSNIEVEDVCFVVRNDKALVTQIKESFRIKKIRHNVEDELGDYKMEFEMSDEKTQNNILDDRLMIFDYITRRMGSEEYSEYVKWREASFTNKKISKFKSFIGFPNLSNDVTEIIGLICKDLIVRIIQTCVKIRKERYKSKVDKNS